MSESPNAVELTVEQAWFIAEQTGAGTFPWVLAITPPYSDDRERAQFQTTQRDALARIGLLSSDGTVNAVAADWIRIACYCDQWLELRYVGPSNEILRGLIARRGARTVVALRNAALVTFTAMAVDHPEALAPTVTAGLSGGRPAAFEDFELPARVGARADEQLRSGANVADVLDFLGVPPSARPVVEAAFTGPRSYVEVVAGQRRDGRETTSEVGVGIVDATAGRILVCPHRAPDGVWISTFTPGTDRQIAVALERLTATLPDGRWFPDAHLTREFITQN